MFVGLGLLLGSPHSLGLVIIVGLSGMTLSLLHSGFWGFPLLHAVEYSSLFDESSPVFAPPTSLMWCRSV
jgi:hypothetical protein